MKPGPRDHLITEALARELARIDPALVDREALDAAEGPLRLSRHLAAVIQRVLGGEHDAGTQAVTTNEVLTRSAADRGELIVLPPEVWRGLRRPPERLGDKATETLGLRYRSR